MEDGFKAKCFTMPGSCLKGPGLCLSQGICTCNNCNTCLLYSFIVFLFFSISQRMDGDVGVQLEARQVAQPKFSRSAPQA